MLKPPTKTEKEKEAKSKLDKEKDGQESKQRIQLKQWNAIGKVANFCNIRGCIFFVCLCVYRLCHLIIGYVMLI